MEPHLLIWPILILLLIWAFTGPRKKSKSKHHSQYKDTGIKGNFMGYEYFPDQIISKHGPEPLTPRPISPPPVPPGVVDKNLLPDPVTLEELARWIEIQEPATLNDCDKQDEYVQDLTGWAEYLRTLQ